MRMNRITIARLVHFLPLAIALLNGLALAPRLQAQSAAETNAFRAAAFDFQHGLFDKAAKGFNEFVTRYPTSSYVPQAVLWQARAALKLQNARTAVDLLSTNASRAGPLGDEYRYLLGEAQAQNGNLRAAAEAFASLGRDFTNSARLLEASYEEARTRFKLKEWRRVIELLENPDGSFQHAAAIRASDELAVSGRLLLVEARLETGEFAVAETGVSTLNEADLTPEFKWRRRYLLCRIQLGGERLAEALTGSTNLMVLAAATGQANLEAESVALQGDILRRLGELGAATAAYERNLADNVPAERRRRALLNLIQLALAQDKLSQAQQRLEAFLAKHPEDAASDAVLLALGEVHLKQHLQPSLTNGATNAVSPPTNHLALALAQFDILIDRTNSALLGQAHLDRGWCLWLKGRFGESQAAFQAAADSLSPSEEQAIARFKLADAQFQQKDFTNAVRNFRALLRDYAGVPRVQNFLFDRALYQTLRASLEINDPAGTEQATRQLLKEYPDSFFADRSLLLLGQNLTQFGQPAEARAVFVEFTNRFPASPLLPDVELAVARTFVHEADWPAALRQYESWLARFETNSLRPYAEFNRALAGAKAGQRAEALRQFTNFVSRFPTNDLAPEAQYWVGNFYYDQKDFVNAQRSFQTIIESTQWPVTRLTYESRMMAGRSAYARQGWKDATNHFAAIINDVMNCPPDLAAEAFFALGDTLIKQDPDPANPLGRFDNAREAFRKIITLFPTNELVPRAWGRIGDCYLQLASGDSKFYTNAVESYQQAMTAPGADVSTRSLAEFALGQVFERQARLAVGDTNLLAAAFDRYYQVYSSSQENLGDGERADPWLVKEAGLNAARLAEERGDWNVAAAIYQRLRERFPPLRRSLEKKHQRATEQVQVRRERE